MHTKYRMKHSHCFLKTMLPNQELVCIRGSTANTHSKSVLQGLISSRGSFSRSLLWSTQRVPVAEMYLWSETIKTTKILTLKVPKQLSYSEKLPVLPHKSSHSIARRHVKGRTSPLCLYHFSCENFKMVRIFVTSTTWWAFCSGTWIFRSSVLLARTSWRNMLSIIEVQQDPSTIKTQKSFPLPLHPIVRTSSPQHATLQTKSAVVTAQQM